MRIESHELLPHFTDHFHLVDENFVQIGDVNLYVALGLVDGMKQVHVLAGDVH